jgi:uncharacterized membrane protein
MFLEISPEIFPLLISFLCVFVPVIILLIVVIVMKSSKAIKNNKTKKANAGIEYETYFGGSSNIEHIEVKMSRVNVTVKDLEKVDFDKLKQLNMGVLVVGNVVKCASAEFAALVEQNSK